MSSLPQNLIERVWRALWPSYPLLKSDGYFAVYHDGGLVAAESLSELACMVAELNGVPSPAFDISAGIEVYLPRRR